MCWREGEGGGGWRGLLLVEDDGVPPVVLGSWEWRGGDALW